MVEFGIVLILIVLTILVSQNLLSKARQARVAGTPRAWLARRRDKVTLVLLVFYLAAMLIRVAMR